MVPLGLNLTTMGAIGGNFISPEATVIEDYMWSLASAGNLQPLATGVARDFHDTWDLDGTDYMPQLVVATDTAAAVSDEGYWDVSADKAEIFPLDV